MAEGLCAIDCKGRVIYANPAAARMLGETHLDKHAETQGLMLPLLSKNLHFSSRSSDDKAADNSSSSGFQPGQTLFNHEDFLIRSNGTLLPIRLNAAPLIQNNEITGSVISFRDISSEKRAEEGLKKNEARFRWLSDSNMIGIFFADVFGKIYDANDAFLDMLGYTRKDLQQGLIDWLQITPPEYLIPYGDLFETIRQEGCIRYLEKEYFKKDGARLDVSISITLLEGSVDQTVCLVQDISERKRFERALHENEARLKHYAQELEQSNQLLSDFATVASHDLQAPLRKIRIFSDILDELTPAQLDAEHRDYLHRIQASVIRMQALIDDLLSLARISTRDKLFKPVQVKTVFQRVLLDFEENIQELQADITLEGQLTVDADPVQIGQLCQNLIDNALKFHRPDGPLKITITLQAITPNLGEIRVEDCGIGFKQQYAERIFNMFERLHGASQYPGTGIGLAICKKIVERHEGTIRAEGSPSQGAIFTVQLPIRQTPCAMSGSK